jgi:hypothetical protein
MRTAEEYRQYAEECERMAKKGSTEHRETLLKIAKAWRECAHEAEQRQKKSGPKRD